MTNYHPTHAINNFRYITFSILIITLGCLLAGAGDLEFDSHAYLMGTLSVFAQAGYLTLVQKSSETLKTQGSTLPAP